MRLVLLVLLASCVTGADAIVDDDPYVDDDEPFALEDAITPEALIAHLDALQAIADAHDGTRALGTPGYDASVGYAVEVFEDAGLVVEIEALDVDRYQVEHADLDIDVELLDGFAALGWTLGGVASGSVVPVDVQVPPGPSENSSTSGCEPADFAEFPSGAIALVQRGSCPFQDKLDNAYDAGAAAVLVFNEGQDGRTGVLERVQLSRENATPIPMLGLSYADGASIVAAAGEATVTASIDVAAGIVSVSTANVLASTPGGAAQGGVFVGAHLDSVPAGPGLNDNGTGVATVLEIAVQVAQRGREPEKRVTFALWAAEEVGLVGSTTHALRRQRAETLDEVGAYLNFDMSGSPNGGRFVYDSAALPDGSDDLTDRFVGFFDRSGLAWGPVPLEGRSDHAAFAALGVPVGGLFSGAEVDKSEQAAVAFGGEPGEPYDACYHRACDDRLNVDTVLLYELARAAAHVVWDTAGDATGAVGARRASRRGALPEPDAWADCSGHVSPSR